MLHTLASRMALPGLALLGLALLVAQPAYAQVDRSAVERVVAEAVANNAFEGTVLVADQGEVVYHEAFGFTDVDQQRPVNADAPFGIASITKMFTAIAVLQQVEEGAYALSDNVASLLPGSDIPNADVITVHHLLLNISGLPSESDRLYQAARSAEAMVQETVKKRGKRLGAFHYANVNYVLLGLLIEQADQMPWREAIQARILDRVGMTETGFLAKDAYPDAFAHTFSYTRRDKRRADPAFHIENFHAAGAMYATAADLLKLDQAMYGDLLLSETSKTLMYTSYPEYNYSGYSVWTYAYPFAPSKPNIMERRGSILGANSVLIRMLDRNQTIVILSNNNRFNPDSFGETTSLREALIIAVAQADG
ncbi:MAG: serine hydrolase domain-containing protein [Bacteroidota bacterium]